METDESWKLIGRGSLTIEKATLQSTKDIKSWWDGIPQADKKKMLESSLKELQKQVRDLEAAISKL